MERGRRVACGPLVETLYSRTSVHTFELKYRADIDGLRAVAIIPVLLFHAGVRQVSGGFVGVDVFFVISGYLITGLILNDISKDRFSIAHFYERRVRRIIPALFVVLTFTSLAAYLLLMPANAKEFGQSLLATSFFSSKVVFWQQTGYFATPAETKPLLHTWSLAVEEQFYIFYPLFLFLVSRYLRKRYALALLAILLPSLALSIWGVYTKQSAPFYLAPARAWELLLGGLLAMQVVPPLRNRMTANVLALLGAALLIYSFVAFSGAVPFPGLNALIPTVGAALIIYSGTACGTGVARVLSARPIAYVGLISYSLYLWHWVLIVYLKSCRFRPLTFWEITAVIAVSFLIASISRRFVENPFLRRERRIGSRRVLFAGAAMGSMVFAIFGGVLYASNGLPSRFSPQVLALLAGKEDVWKRYDECQNHICRLGDNGTAPSFLVWGDSHAGVIAPVFEYLADANKSSGFAAFKGGCAPLLKLRRYDFGKIEDCAGFNASILELIKSEHITKVFLHARWASYSEGTRYGHESGTPTLLTRNLRVEEDFYEFETLFRFTIEELRKLRINVVVIASVPEIGMDVPAVLAYELISGAKVELAPRYSDFIQRQARTFGVFSGLAADSSVRVIYPHEILCDSSSCQVVRDRHSLYTDGNHLTLHAAMFLVPELAPSFEDSMAKGAKLGVNGPVIR